MTYTVAALVGVAAAVGVDLLLTRTRLLLTRTFWVAYAIVLFFQLVVNGLLTGLRIVRYDPAQILGPRLAFAPVEDLLFGFAMILFTLSLWVSAGRRDARRRAAAGADAAQPAPSSGRPTPRAGR
ncbi:MAG TPA: lycopene cyclase domain-containing protein [Jatrophihabitans sp.]|nr:lycopene cyclase domain-containing protein [Jatrophihabitans sp.]